MRRYPGNHTDSELLTVPRFLKTRPQAPTTHLAYITDDEADLLKDYKPGTPHEGAEGIPNYDTWGIDSSGTVTGGSTAGGGGGWSGDTGGGQSEPEPWSGNQNQNQNQVVPTSTPEMTTGFGSWFGANTGSTASSQVVQDTIQS